MFNWLRRLFPVQEPQFVVASPTLIAQMFSAINTTRVLKGIKPVDRSNDADAIAQQWADHLAQGNGYIGHGDFSSRVSGPFPNKAAFENIEEDGYTLESDHTGDVVDNWMADSAHRNNLLSNADVVGIGCATSDGQNYWVIDFIKLNS